MMDTTYTMSGVSGMNTAMKRIRTPHPHDVLSGRGGGINSHEGNRTFRDWVRERKNQYNLAMCKAEKARVAKEVINLVKSLNPPGRFLQRDTSTGAGGMCWWIEVDETKAMAKTSQALREGAPQIRAAHKDDVQPCQQKNKRRNSGKKSLISSAQSIEDNNNSYSTFQSTPDSPLSPPISREQHMNHPVSSSVSVSSNDASISGTKETPILDLVEINTGGSTTSNEWVSSLAPPLTFSDEYTDASYVRPAKRARVEDGNENFQPPFPGHKQLVVDYEAETPPLAPVPASLASVPSLNVNSSKLTPPKRCGFGMRRANSLALSDIPGDWELEEDFVNPFEDESDVERLSRGAALDVSTAGTCSTQQAGTIGDSSHQRSSLVWF